MIWPIFLLLPFFPPFSAVLLLPQPGAGSGFGVGSRAHPCGLLGLPGSLCQGCFAASPGCAGSHAVPSAGRSHNLFPVKSRQGSLRKSSYYWTRHNITGIARRSLVWHGKAAGVKEVVECCGPCSSGRQQKLLCSLQSEIKTATPD